MIVKLFAPAFFAAAAAAVISAPGAGASAAECDDDGPASVCARNGHTTIFAEPQQSGMSPTFVIAPGAGPMPPLLAMN